MLEGVASKCSKITDLFRSQALTSCAGELTVSQSSTIDVIARRELAQAASQMCMCWLVYFRRINDLTDLSLLMDGEYVNRFGTCSSSRVNTLHRYYRV